MLFKLIGTKKDITQFFIVCVLLILSYYFELYTSLLTGHVLTAFNIKDMHDIEELAIPKLIYEKILHNNFTTVDDIRKSIILSFIIIKVLQSLFYVLNVYIHHNACDA